MNDEGCAVLRFGICLCERILASSSFVREQFLQAEDMKGFKSRIGGVNFGDSSTSFFAEEELRTFRRFEEVVECLV